MNAILEETDQVAILQTRVYGKETPARFRKKLEPGRSSFQGQNPNSASPPNWLKPSSLHIFLRLSTTCEVGTLTNDTVFGCIITTTTNDLWEKKKQTIWIEIYLSQPTNMGFENIEVSFYVLKALLR